MDRVAQPPKLFRQQILAHLLATLEPQPAVLAMWEAGAAAFGRLDEWSDLDLLVVVEDDFVEQVFPLVETALLELSPIDLRYPIPQPTWHGHAQTFYRLAHASPFLLIDLAVMKRSSPDKFLQPEMHGRPVVYFDKAGIVQPTPLDQQELKRTLAIRRETLRTLFDLFQTLTLKELNRGNHLEAISFYFGYTLRPLVELLRIRYQPERYNFHTRYIHYDLPAEVLEKLTPLFYPQDPADLRAKQAQAVAWFHALDRAAPAPD